MFENTRKKQEIKWKKQRAEKCYCDLDVHDLDMWLEKTLLSILKEFKERHCGHPCGMTEDEWDNILGKMIFLLTEMDEETCSKQLNKNYDFMEQQKYMTKCKDEFYDLLKEYHWDLWY